MSQDPSYNISFNGENLWWNFHSAFPGLIWAFFETHLRTSFVKNLKTVLVSSTYSLWYIFTFSLFPDTCFESSDASASPWSTSSNCRELSSPFSRHPSWPSPPRPRSKHPATSPLARNRLRNRQRPTDVDVTKCFLTTVIKKLERFNTKIKKTSSCL